MFEESVTRLAEAISSQLDREEQAAQEMFPHYFDQKTIGTIRVAITLYRERHGRFPPDKSTVEALTNPRWSCDGQDWFYDPETGRDLSAKSIERTKAMGVAAERAVEARAHAVQADTTPAGPTPAGRPFNVQLDGGMLRMDDGTFREVKVVDGQHSSRLQPDTLLHVAEGLDLVLISPDEVLVQFGTRSHPSQLLRDPDLTGLLGRVIAPVLEGPKTVAELIAASPNNGVAASELISNLHTLRGCAGGEGTPSRPTASLRTHGQGVQCRWSRRSPRSFGV